MDLEKLNKLLEKSWGFSKIQNRKLFTCHIQFWGVFNFALTATSEELYNSGAPLKNLHKDLAIIKETCGDLQLTLPALTAAWNVIDKAMKQQRGRQDMAALVEVLDTRWKFRIENIGKID